MLYTCKYNTMLAATAYCVIFDFETTSSSLRAQSPWNKPNRVWYANRHFSAKMSADSPCKASKNLIGKIVLPGPVVDRSIIDSVAGFIHDVVPHVSNCSDVSLELFFIEFNRWFNSNHALFCVSGIFKCFKRRQ